MGAKTGLLAYAEGEIAQALRRASEPSTEETVTMIGRLYPGHHVERTDDSSLGEEIHPPEGITYAASLPGVDIVCDRRFMIDHPSRLPAHLIEASAGRRLVLHAMHSVVDWLAFAVWENGRLVRSLSLSPDSGILENIGRPFPFEAPYWAGEHPVDPDPSREDEEPYPLPFHPLELGEEALRALFGFVVEGMPGPDDVDPDDVGLCGFRLTESTGSEPADEKTDPEAAVRATEHS
ncbi:hypothetical protein GCM10017559_21060 [Streptosporangium longisporum]|uniref:Condensation domain-containing protein n=2 Tax=Streptosporangium longisporum TaxID=46187 RepID=A0ABN3XV95_9ACTN